MHVSGSTAMAEAGAVPELIKGAGQWGSTSVKCWNMRVGVKLMHVAVQVTYRQMDAHSCVFFFFFGSNLLCWRDNPYVTHMGLRVSREGHILNRH